MKKRLLKTLSLAALLFISIATFAVPAEKKPVTVIQPNGKTLTFILQGDERVNWATTLDGYALIKNSDNNFVYAKQDANGNMVASNILAANENERSASEISFLASVPKDLHYSAEQVKNFKKIWTPKAGVKEQSFFPSKGKNKLLVVLVSFSDVEFTTDNSVFENFCSQENFNGTGSVRDYFLVNSNGELDLDIDVIGPYALPSVRKTYGSNAGAAGSYKFVRDAIIAADAYVDYSQYDNDGDGIVDDIAFIYAGTPASTTGDLNTIWPHSGSVDNYGYGAIVKDGVKINRYTCSSEKPSPTIGTFCHEFGHALGLPDEYDTDYGGNGSGSKGSALTVGTWSVMCEGSYNNGGNSPCLWSAGQKLATGWLKELDTLDAPQDSILLPLVNAFDNKAYRINIDNNEFIMIEQRKKEGFDAYIPGSGLLIYHGQMNKITPWFTKHHNTVNTNPNDRGWYIEVADGVAGKADTNASHLSTSSACFPGSANVCYFTNNSPNNAKKVNGTALDIAITSIQYINDSVMMFNYNSSLPMVQTGNKVGTNDIDKFTAGGTIKYNPSGAAFASKGLVYSTDENCPYDENSLALDTTLSDTVNINVTVTGLQIGTKYYYRAFVKTEAGVIALGDIKFTTTDDGLGFATTQSAINVDSTSATIRGTLSLIGKGAFVEKGFVYVINDATTDPVVGGESTITLSYDDSVTGSYTHDLSNLQQGYTYYYRAYVTNTFGTYYGTKLSFQTKYPAISNNTISASQTICVNTSANELTGTVPVGGFGNFTYLWQQKTGYGSWEEAEGTNNTVSYQPHNLTQTTQFRRVAISDNLVQQMSNIITITVKSSVGGTISPATAAYQKGESITFTLKDYNGDILQWERSSDGTNWTSLNNAGSETYQETFSAEGTFYYRVLVQVDNCEAAYSAVKTIDVKASAINEVNNDLVFEIMPNPVTNGTFTINSDIMNAQSVVVTNALGQVVYSEKNVNLNGKTITLDNAENGSYFINVIVDNKQTAKKIIINK